MVFNQVEMGKMTGREAVEVLDLSFQRCFLHSIYGLFEYIFKLLLSLP